MFYCQMTFIISWLAKCYPPYMLPKSDPSHTFLCFCNCHLFKISGTFFYFDQVNKDPNNTQISNPLSAKRFWANCLYGQYWQLAEGSLDFLFFFPTLNWSRVLRLSLRTITISSCVLLKNWLVVECKTCKKVNFSRNLANF